MNVAAKVCLFLGLISVVAWQTYASGSAAILIAAILFLPVFGLLFWLRSRIRRKMCEARSAASSMLAVGVWLLCSSTIGALMVRHPGHEADGLLGVLVFLYPLCSSLVSCLIVAWWLPKKQLTYIHFGERQCHVSFSTLASPVVASSKSRHGSHSLFQERKRL
jgi:hypothetical protein